jgi:hypothetical protein
MEVKLLDSSTTRHHVTTSVRLILVVTGPYHSSPAMGQDPETAPNFRPYLLLRFLLKLPNSCFLTRLPTEILYNYQYVFLLSTYPSYKLSPVDPPEWNYSNTVTWPRELARTVTFLISIREVPHSNLVRDTIMRGFRGCLQSRYANTEIYLT